MLVIGKTTSIRPWTTTTVANLLDFSWVQV
jgi:hypothetical protein